MNRIYILGEVLSVSKMRFDYYNKLKAYFKFSILDMHGNVFECVVQEKRCDGSYKNVKMKLDEAFYLLEKRKTSGDVVFVTCSCENGEYLVDNIY